MGLTLLRHTAPQVAANTCYGRLDLPPGPAFEAEAGALIAELSPVARLLTSPLQRCRLLAERIGQARGLPVQIVPDLTEIDFGRWEGLAWDAVPRTELDTWAADFWHARPHGGESVAQFAARTARFLSGCHAARDWLAVTHAGQMRAAVHLLGRDPDWTQRFAYGERLVLDCADLATFVR